MLKKFRACLPVLLLVAALGVCTTQSIPIAQADQAAFSWDYPVPPPSPIDGFKLYCGTATGVYAAAPVATVTASVKTATLTIPAGVKQFCVVRAFKGTDPESPNSNEASVTGRPDAPTGFKVVLTLTWNPITGEVYAKAETVKE